MRVNQISLYSLEDAILVLLEMQNLKNLCTLDIPLCKQVVRRVSLLKVISARMPSFRSL